MTILVYILFVIWKEKLFFQSYNLSNSVSSHTLKLNLMKEQETTTTDFYVKGAL